MSDSSHKKRERALAEQNATQMTEASKSKDEGHNESSKKRPPDSPGVSVSDVDTDRETQNVARNEMKVTRSLVNGLIHHPNGYANGTFYQL